MPVRRIIQHYTVSVAKFLAIEHISYFQTALNSICTYIMESPRKYQNGKYYKRISVNGGKNVRYRPGKEN